MESTIVSTLPFLSARQHTRTLSAVSPGVRQCLNLDAPQGTSCASIGRRGDASEEAGVAVALLLPVAAWWLGRVPTTSLVMHNATDEVLCCLARSTSAHTLVSLDLSFSRAVGDAGLKSIKHLTHLATLNLTGCIRVSDHGVCALLTNDATTATARCPLTSLSVAQCRLFTDAGLQRLAVGMPALERLNVSRTAVSDVGMTTLGCSGVLRSVLRELNACGCIAVTDASLKGLSQLRALEVLRLARLRVRTSIPTTSATPTSHQEQKGPHDGHVGGSEVLTSTTAPPLPSERPSHFLGSLKSLHTLDVSGSAFSDHDVRNLRPLRFCLQTLNLSNCYALSDHGLTELMDLVRLRTVLLSGVVMARSAVLLDGFVRALPDLEVLSLSECCHQPPTQQQQQQQRSAAPPPTVDDAVVLFAHRQGRYSAVHNAAFCRLTDVNLCGCEIYDHALEDIGALLPALTALNVSRCRMLTNAAMEYIGCATSLRTLIASDLPRVTDAGVASLQRLEGLTLLDAAQCCITNRGLLTIAQQHHLTLERLVVRDCFRIDDVGVAQFVSATVDGAPQGCRRLTALALSGCSLTDSGMAAMVELGGSLTELDLSGCSELTDDGILQLSGFSVLKVLVLTRCLRLTDACMGAMVGMQDLRSLHLSKCQGITDDGLRTFARTAAHPSHCLETLNLSHCPHITNVGCAYLSRFFTLQHLDMSGTGCTVWGTQQLMLALPQLHDVLVSAQR